MPQQKPNVEIRHVIMRHGSSFSQLVFHVDCVRSATAVFNPHAKQPQVLRSYTTADEARSAFAGILRAFKDHGWHPIYDGRPNFG